MIGLEDAAPYLRLHRDAIFVVKVGGACLERPGLLRALARQLAVVQACGARPVLVHGAGPQVDVRQRLLGEEPRKIGGRRVTSDAALAALRTTTQESLGPAFVAALEEAGAPAELLPGERCAVASRRPPVETAEGLVDFGHVGDLEKVDPAPIFALVSEGCVPVISPPAASAEGEPLNVNADLLAALIAATIGATKLVLATSVPGVLLEPSEAGSLASTLALADLEQLAESGAIAGGMLVKAEAARIALQNGVPRVHVVSGLDPHALLGELYTTHGTGTLLTTEPLGVPVEEEAPA